MNLTGGVTILGYLIGVAGAITIIFSKVKTENLKDLQKRVDILDKELKYNKEQNEKDLTVARQQNEADKEHARTQNMENQKAISNLQGQLSTYKEIPLKQIANSLESLATSNDRILRQLQTSADKLADTAQADGVLVHTDENNPLMVKVENT